jgi:tetratricopeptide (TPR) repeat protein
MTRLTRRIEAIPPWLRGAALAALALAVYWPTFANGYISDDEIYIRGIEELRSLAGLRDIWFRIGAIPQYYPLVHTSFWFEYRIWGLAPLGFHAANVALHAGVAILVWRLLLVLRVPGAWFAAALFAVHPVHVETVAWASERKNLYSAAFALGSMLAYLRFAPADAVADDERARPPHATRYYVLSLALYVAALLSKTVVVSTPAVLLVVRWWKSGRIGARDLRPLLPFFAIGVPLSLLTVWIERVHVGATGAAWELTPPDRVLIAGRAVWFYLGKLFWPHPLGFVYPRWTPDPYAAWQWAFPATLVLLALALFALRHRVGRGPLAALLLFVGVLVPALGFFDVYPFLFSFVADHYQYHASIAVIAFAAAAASLATANARAVGAAAAIATLAILGGLAHRETYGYRDDLTLIHRGVALQPESWAAHYRLGAALQKERRFEEAIVEYQEALRLYPDYAPAHGNVAINLVSLGRNDEAVAAFERALAGDLDDDHRATAQLHLGNLRVTQGRFDDAARAFRAGAALSSAPAEFEYNLGVVLRQLGDTAGAREAVQDSVAHSPDVAKSRHALGAILLESADAAGAAEQLRAAIELEPDHAAARALLDVALERMRTTPEPDPQYR